jgi:hypothetical protein
MHDIINLLLMPTAPAGFDAAASTCRVTGASQIGQENIPDQCAKLKTEGHNWASRIDWPHRENSLPEDMGRRFGTSTANMAKTMNGRTEVLHSPGHLAPAISTEASQCSCRLLAIAADALAKSSIGG